MPKALSPTGIMLFFRDRDEYYLKYLAEERTPYLPQTQPMSVGSAFDAYVKSHLAKNLFGNAVPPDLVFETMFETQVESQNRDWARTAGMVAFLAYQNSGALSDLMIQLEQAQTDPVFESRMTKEVEGVPMIGVPDLTYISKEGAKVIFDWKVNGYCSKASPAKGYIVLRDGWKHTDDRKPSRSHGKAHKDCLPDLHLGVRINSNTKMEDVKDDWAMQLAVYSFLHGWNVSPDLIGQIHQLACDGPGNIRIAEHSCPIGVDFQKSVIQKAKDVWGILESGHIFQWMTREESDQKCEQLERFAFGLNNPEDDTEAWVNEILR